MSAERRPRAGLAPSGPPGDGRVLPFRRRAVKPRRRKRSLALRLLKPLLGAVALVGLPLALGGWVLTSPQFALRELEVVAGDRVPRAWVESRLAPLAGRNLLWLPLAEVDRALAGHPWVAGLGVRKELPSRLVVEVMPRRPAALVPKDGEPWFADAAGRPIAPLGDEDPGELLLVTTPPGAAVDGAGVPLALAVAEELAAAVPEWAAGTRRIEALSNEDARVHTAALPCPLLLRVGQIAPRARRLTEVLPELGARYPQMAALDLRFSRRIVVRPSDAPEMGSS